MLPHIQEQFERLARKHKAFIDHIASPSEAVQSYKAGPDKWSVVEVVEHLVHVEKETKLQGRNGNFFPFEKHIAHASS